jgi:hypothetical protein
VGIGSAVEHIAEPPAPINRELSELGQEVTEPDFHHRGTEDTKLREAG